MKNSADGINRADKFYDEVINTGVVYIIKTKNGGPLVCPSNEFFNPETNEQLPVIPVWSESYLAYARKYGEDMDVAQITFEEFFYGMLPTMRNDNVIVGLNWDMAGIGVEQFTGETIRVLAKLLNKKYEPESLKRVEVFLEEALKNKKIYYLADKDTGKVFICPSYESINSETNEPIPVIPVWSESYLEYPKIYGAELEVDEMDIEVLKNDLLQDMNKDGILLGINLDENGFGIEEQPAKIIMKLGGVVK